MSPNYYENITLVSLDGDLSVVLYLPYGTVHTTSSTNGGGGSSSSHHNSNNNNHEKNYYYYGSRFDHGSMIGSITTKRRVSKTRPSPQQQQQQQQQGPKEEVEEEEVEQQRHELFGSDMWRLPHNSHWPESGIGLAAEFGVGDDGDLCDMKCGYSAASYGITNGVLGYTHNHNDDDRDQFLKIGVGVLLKGTCPACDSTNDYKFNSPYMLAEMPVWTVQEQMQRIDDTHVVTILLDHEATTSSRRYGYKIHKEIYIHPDNSSLIVTTQLYNIGQAAAAAGDADAAFSTVWYSHNFFTCDHQPVGPGYSVDLDIQGDTILQQQESPPPPGMVVDPSSSMTSSLLYDEPGTWSWSKPIAEYSTIQSYPQSVHVQMNREMEPGIRIKTEFKNDRVTRGGFTMRACDTIVESALSWPDQFQVKDDDDSDNEDNSNQQKNPTIEMYAYNLYMERGTMSPEPQLLFSNVQPGSHVEWTQTITIRPANDDNNNNHHHHDTMQHGSDEMANEPPPMMTWLPTMWMTHLFPGSQTPPQQQPLPPITQQQQDRAGSVVMTIVPVLSFVLLAATSSIRRYRRRHRQRRQQYESIA